MVQPQVKRIWVLVLVGLFAGAGVAGFLLARGSGSTPKYRVARVERGPLTAVVAANGTLNSVVSVQVGTQVSGQIQKLLVDFNSVVRKDQVIAQIDPEIFEAKVSQARADVESTQATVVPQEAQVERPRAGPASRDRGHARLSTRPGEAEAGRPPSGAGRPRAHDDSRARRRGGRFTGGGRRTDRRREPAGPHPLHHRSRPDQDAGRDERGRGGYRPDQSR